jgi:hypothetical protein
MIPARITQLSPMAITMKTPRPYMSPRVPLGTVMDTAALAAQPPVRKISVISRSGRISAAANKFGRKMDGGRKPAVSLWRDDLGRCDGEGDGYECDQRLKRKNVSEQWRITAHLPREYVTTRG